MSLFVTKGIYSRPEVLTVGYAIDVILGRAECKSKQIAKRLRQLIDQSGGNLSCSPAKECRKFQVDLSLVSKQFRKLYHTTMRAYSRQVRMKRAEQLLRNGRRFNVNETAGILGYSVASAFSRCFHATVGKRPKRYQIQSGNGPEWETRHVNTSESNSLFQT